MNIGGLLKKKKAKKEGGGGKKYTVSKDELEDIKKEVNDITRIEKDRKEMKKAKMIDHLKKYEIDYDDSDDSPMQTAPIVFSVVGGFENIHI